MQKENAVRRSNSELILNVSVRRSGVSGYNSGKTNSINNLFLDLECGINRVAVRSMLQPGDITVTAKCAGLKSDSIKIQSRQFVTENGYTFALPTRPAGVTPKAR